MTRSLRSSLFSTPLALMTVAALALWGCGGDGGGTPDSGTIDGGGGRGGGSGTAGRGGTSGGTAGTGTGGSIGGAGGGTAGTGTGGSTAGTGGGTAGRGGAGGGTAGTGGSTAGTGGGTAGTGGSTAGTGGGTAGRGGAGGGTAGTGGSTAGTGGSTAGTGGSTAGTGGSTAGTGGSTAGTGGSTAGSGGSTAGTGGTSPPCTNGTSCTLAGPINGVCINGACGNCPAGATGDAACVGAYAAGYICVANNCVMGTCHDNTECSGGQICNASHVCAGCGTDDAICGTGRICVSGLCASGNCHTNNNCSNGQVCITNNCQNCSADGQCNTGQLCISNGCVTGNCRVASTDCTGNQICLANNCAPCANDGQCVSTVTGYGTDHLCVGNACVQGNCRAAGDCVAGGTICNTGTMFCGACSAGAAGDTQCSSEYGTGHICNGGVCITGNCHSTADCAASGQVCNLGTHACEACGTDAQCADAANYGANHICQANACINGNCHAAADCNNSAQVCKAFTCGMCSSNADCTAAYGANHVCSGGACVSGNCNTSADCAGNNQLCNTTTHTCFACSSDAQCVADTAQYGPMHICLGTGNTAQCVAGNCHDTSLDCNGTGQICGITTPHTCGNCAGDTTCKNDAYWGNATICLSNACVTGDCHDTSNDCPAGKICSVQTPHTCGNCSAGATGDTQCTMDTRYGSGNICYQGLCGVGNCHATSADCTAANTGLICGAASANTCGTCSTDSACTSDTFYGANFICNTAAGASQGHCVTRACGNNNMACAANTGDFCCGGSCTPGNCCVDGDCGSIGTACVNHTCSACNAVSGNTFYVDPVNGNDSTGTGSNMSGATPAPGCAFKTILRAVNVIGPSPPAGTKIVLVGQGSTPRGLDMTDTLPRDIPTNTTLTTTGGPITITLAQTGAAADAGFRLNTNNAAIAGDPAAPLVLVGNAMGSGIAIRVQPGTATFTSSISNVAIQNTNGDGIRVNAGTVTIKGGVVQSGSGQDGLRVAGGTAIISNAAGTQTLFSTNAAHGIEVSGTGSVSITGTAGAPVPSNNGSVLVSFNTTAGIRINQTPGAAGLVLNNINGLVSWGNNNFDMRIFGGSKVKMRNSVLGGAPIALQISNSGGTAAGNDLTGVDLGTAADFGKNYFQMPNGSLGFHSTAGICVGMSAAMGTLNVAAAGNFMTNAGNPGMQLNCSTAGGTVSTGTCAGRNAFGVTAAAGTAITRDLSMCN